MSGKFNIQLLAYPDNCNEFSEELREKLTTYLKNYFWVNPFVTEARVEGELALCLQYHGEGTKDLNLGELVDMISDNFNMERVVVIESDGCFIPNYGFYFSEEFPMMLIYKFVHQFYERALETMRGQINITIGNNW